MSQSKSLAVKGTLLLVVGLAAREYAHFTYFTQDMARNIVFSLEERPYVYRVLVPWMSRALTWTGLSPETSLTVVIVCMAIGFLYGLIYLFKSFNR